VSGERPLDVTGEPDDRRWMSRAIDLGRLGGRAVRPNPPVGCVLVVDGEIIGQGHHERAGGPHAEIHALAMAGERARGATAYITLEPCNHHGRTPPCSHALIAAGVARVVFAVPDPHDDASGGAEHLRAAGVIVREGVEASAAARLAEVFLVNQRQRRPFVRLKMAATMDGHAAATDGSSRWITGSEARQLVHRWRARADAVLVGSGTALADDPRLDLRHDVVGSAPLRVVADRRLRVHPGLRLADTASQDTLLLTTPDASTSAAGRAMTDEGVEVLAIDVDGDEWLPAALQQLYRRGICELLVEGGATLAAALLNAGLVDRLELFLAPKLLGAGAGLWPGLGISTLADALPLQIDQVDRVGPDLHVSATLAAEEE